jgi:PAS domain S-box-containing protein
MNTNERYRLLVESIQYWAIYMVDRDDQIATWNSGAQGLTGYTAEDAVSAPVSLLYAEQASLLARQQAKEICRERRAPHEFLASLQKKDGSSGWFSIRIHQITDHAGDFFGFSELVREADSADAKPDSRRFKEEQFRLLVQGVTDYAIYMLDMDGHIHTWNSGAERIKGYRAEEITGRHFSTFYTDADRAAGEPARGLAHALAHGRFENQAWRVRKDGSLFWAHVVIDRIDDEHGYPIGFAKVTRDMTESRHTEQAMEEMRRALHQAQKMEAIGHLTGGVAHDFNNLLQVISGNLQLLRTAIADNERALERVDGAMAGVARGTKLASQLLSFGRRQPLAPKVVNPGKLVRDMDDLLRRTLGEGIEVETVVGGGLWNSCIDRSNLENAILNLALNARDAMAGQGKLTIEAGNAYLDDRYARRHHEVKPGQYVLIAVTDTGCGIAAENIEKIFDPFFTTKPEGSGTGLGLSMVYGFVKQSNGHIKIYSELGQGTTVKLYLPRSMEAEDQPTRLSEEPMRGGTESILVVEDDASVRETSVALLRSLGYQVLQAGDAQSALAIIDSGVAVDLLFTDVVMPGPLRSPDLAAKAIHRIPGLAVLFTSGYTENAIVHAGRLDPGVELLSKPYTQESLAIKVRQVLTSARSDRSHINTSPTSTSVEVDDNGSQRKQLMLCEDNDAIRAMVSDLLEEQGYSVLSLATAEEAIEAAQQRKIDLLITDMSLPGKSGSELAYTLRVTRPTLPVLFTTGHLTDPPREIDGRTKMVLKPFGLEELANIVRSMLR